MPDLIQHLTLGNGLHLTLRHTTRLKRAAAALRVHAGSHDAPARWPGLAHFLEHLFFLGTSRFPLENGLMRYVQGLGGQVNATTRERTTDFFFEVPSTALAGGLERLCQMLAEPDLNIERQRREREVIHAEFIAWSRNPQAQRQFARLQTVSARHPLSAFHAGNRYSLPLQNPAFQQALKQFHDDFYQAGQMTLSLCGPQPLDELRALGTAYGALFSQGQRRAPSLTPALLDGPLRQIVTPPGELGLSFAHDHLPPGAEAALELLLAHLGDSRPGGWLGELRARGWLRAYQAEPLYAFAGQVLWHLQLQLSEDASTEQAQALLHGWLAFLRQAEPQRLNHAFGQLQACRARTASALDLARRDAAGNPFQALDSSALHALRALLADLPASDTGHWRLPEPDPLLSASLPSTPPAPLPQGLQTIDLMPTGDEHAALYLRWHVTSPLRERYLPVLEQALRPLQERAERASLRLQWSAAGEHWTLHCSGAPAGVIRTVEQALALLRTPGDWQVTTPPSPPLMPLRALLKALPDALHGYTPLPQPVHALAPPQLEQLWASTHWQGLALGFDTPARNALGTTLRDLMGNPARTPPPRLPTGRHWRRVPDQASEQALLLFCPLPAALQASGRLLAHLLQGPVYQRLRVELQLGYGVFSAYRQLEGFAGLLFGVQSPHATHEEILQHLQTLLSQGVTLEPHARQTLAEQFSAAAMSHAELAEWAWQTQLATHTSNLSDMCRSILMTGQSDLDDLTARLLSAEHGWLCLANGTAPERGWQHW
ncbi:pyrroloquinoline quinone biosynthesis protein PqqF [Pseudomonas entomophila]|uniref:pyrroloquinoline quinone biosynthesis protein PqqF n=1 Tax=Pseudomonas entomophila TaxID=312306 RepID=UPI0023D8251E|nr:pyrroloquinoline quinone biosynthesis protein PqqF [Pseudomonas entomophila]MDF0729802.1 pyrroloquinoline quinone biosynthesis protein PqqF [Pseudomonas entomophila]